MSVPQALHIRLQFLLGDRAYHRRGVGERRFSEAAEEALQEYHWPGNINELRNVVSRALSAAEGKEIEEDLHLSSSPLDGSSNESPSASGGSATDEDEGNTESESGRQETTDGSAETAAPLPGASGNGSIPTIEELKEAAARRAYELCDHNVDRAAVELGIGRSTMYRMLDRYDIR